MSDIIDNPGAQYHEGSCNSFVVAEPGDRDHGTAAVMDEPGVDNDVRNSDVTLEALMLKLERIEKMIADGVVGLATWMQPKTSMMSSQSCSDGLTEIQLKKIEKEDEKLQKQKDCQEVASTEADLMAAIQTKGFVRGQVKSWFAEKGFGFAEVAGRTVFIHTSSVRRAELLKLGTVTVLKVMVDGSRAGNKLKAMEAWALTDWQAEQSLLDAAAVAAKAKRAAEVSARLATNSLEVSESAILRSQTAWIQRPPGLDQRLKEKYVPKGNDETPDSEVESLAKPENPFPDLASMGRAFRTRYPAGLPSLAELAKENGFAGQPSLADMMKGKYAAKRSEETPVSGAFVTPIKSSMPRAPLAASMDTVGAGDVAKESLATPTNSFAGLHVFSSLADLAKGEYVAKASDETPDAKIGALATPTNSFAGLPLLAELSEGHVSAGLPSLADLVKGEDSAKKSDEPPVSGTSTSESDAADEGGPRVVELNALCARAKAFIRTHDLSDSVASRIGSLPRDQQEELASKSLGPRVRNPSGYVLKIVWRLESQAEGREGDENHGDYWAAGETATADAGETAIADAHADDESGDYWAAGETATADAGETAAADARADDESGDFWAAGETATADAGETATADPRADDESGDYWAAGETATADAGETATADPRADDEIGDYWGMGNERSWADAMEQAKYDDEENGGYDEADDDWW